MFRAVIGESYRSIGFKGTVTFKYFQTLLQDGIKNQTWGNVRILYEEGEEDKGVKLEQIRVKKKPFPLEVKDNVE